MKKYRLGFTLIELMVVIAIVALLAVIVITFVRSAQTRSRNSTAKQDVTQMGKAIETWKTSNGVMNAPGSGAYSGAGGTVTSSMTTTDITSALGSNLTYLNGTGAYGGWSNLFNTAVSGAMPIKMLKTPGAEYKYIYIGSSRYAGDIQAPTGNPLLYNPLAVTYCIGTNISTANGVSDNSFYVTNSISKNGSSADLVVNASNAGTCS